jgi:hypothetical protein
MDIVTIKLDKITMKKLEKQIQNNVTIAEMENCLDNINEVTCYELFRTDTDLIWIKFDRTNSKIEIIREEQS